MFNKKISILIVTLLLSTLGYSQQQENYFDPSAPVLLQVHNFSCMPSAVFTKLPAEYTAASFADANNTINPYTKVAESYDATAPIGTMRFWGTVDIKPSESFLIEFYDGAPNQIGTIVVQAFNVTTSPVPTGFDLSGGPIFQFDVTFDNVVNQLNGWVSISRTTVPYVSPFMWVHYDDEGSIVSESYSYNSNTGIWEEAQYDRIMFFCFGPASVATVPVSNWALFIGLTLIIGFIFFRIRNAF